MVDPAVILLLSPAKTMKWPPDPPGLAFTLPLFMESAAVLADIARALTVEQLCRLMSLSPALGVAAWQRFQEFAPPFTLDNSRPAAMLYRGDTYVGLDADTLSVEDWAFAQDRLRILSGLFGLLRPLDLIQPYRLEMGVGLVNPMGKDLYAFWRQRLTRQLNEMVGDGVVVNLASEEYSRAVDAKGIGGRFITPVFQEIRHGRRQVIGLLAKRSRGRMARFIIRNRIEKPEEMQGFTEEGYTYDPTVSTPERWIFFRGGE